MTLNEMKGQVLIELYNKARDILTERPETLTSEEFHEHLGAMHALATVMDVSKASHACIYEMEFREVRKEARKRRAQCITTT